MSPVVGGRQNLTALRISLRREFIGAQAGPCCRILAVLVEQQLRGGSVSTCCLSQVLRHHS
jgi:hypothetical protein